MHDTAFALAQRFFRIYLCDARTIVEIGAMNVNGSLRTVAPAAATYIGLDLEAGPGVDVVVASGADIPLRDGVVDIALASSAFEHDRQFWRTFISMCRVTRPGGYIYINAPSNGAVHAYPLDCWRFYPDAGLALEQLAASERWPVRLVESFVAERRGDGWNDFVAVFRREGTGGSLPSARLHHDTACRNIFDASAKQRLNVDACTEDMRLLAEANTTATAQQEQLIHETGARDRRIAELAAAISAQQDRMAHEMGLRDSRIADLAAANASLEGRLDALTTEIDAFRASWSGRFYDFWNKRFGRPGS